MRMRIVVIGGGVMGCATALALRARRADVIVLERAVPGAEASSAAAGMLAAQIESHDAGERDKYVRARAAYEEWATELREITGIDIGYRKSGAVVVARGNARDALTENVRAQVSSGLRAEIVDGPRAHAIEPDLADDVDAAAYFPDEAQVDPPQLLRALVVATTRAGVTIRSGTTVSSLLRQEERCVGVRLDGGENLHADAVVVAAGSWSSFVEGLPDTLPRVKPVRGQLVLLEQRPPRLRTIVFSDRSYVVPRGDGRVVCGSTMEDVGHRREVTAAGVTTILSAALAIAPKLGEAELVRAWCNFRPYVGSGAPLVGRSPLAGLFLATGHHRNGILLAKTTADDVAATIFSSL